MLVGGKTHQRLGAQRLLLKQCQAVQFRRVKEEIQFGGKYLVLPKKINGSTSDTEANKLSNLASRQSFSVTKVRSDVEGRNTTLCSYTACERAAKEATEHLSITYSQ